MLGAASFVGLCAQVSIPLPFTPVPLTLQTFAVLLVGAALGSLRGAAAMVLYAVAGLVGVPWFAQGSSGYTAPSFGYIVGFILAAAVVGRLAERGSSRATLSTVGMLVLGSVIIYAVGVSWLKVALGTTWATAISLGLTPFIVGDLIKLAAAASLLPLSWAALRKSGLSS